MIYESVGILTISKAQNRNKEERIGIFERHSIKVSSKIEIFFHILYVIQLAKNRLFFKEKALVR